MDFILYFFPQDLSLEWSAFLHSLFARQSFIERFVAQWTEGYFFSLENLLEVVLASTIFIFSYFSGRYFHTPHKQAWWRVLAFPIILLISAILLSFIWRQVLHQPIVWLRFLVLLALWILLIRLMLMVVRYIVARKSLSHGIEKILSLLLWVVGLMWLSGVAHLVLDWSKHQFLPLGKNPISLYTIMNGIFWVLIILMAAMWLARLIEARLMKIDKIDWNVRIVLANIVKMVLLLIALLFALSEVGIDLTILSVFGGALGVGLGFGLQKVASNYISGFIILLDHSIRLGDRLVVDTFTGYVSKITSRYVVLKNTSGSEALVPNDTFIANTVINESYSDTALWRSINLQVAYQTHIPQAMEIMRLAACKQPRIKQEGDPPSAYLTHFSTTGIELALGFWVLDPENGFMGLTSDILLDIWQQFSANGIEFAIPQQEIVLHNSPQEK